MENFYFNENISKNIKSILATEDYCSCDFYNRIDNYSNEIVN